MPCTQTSLSPVTRVSRSCAKNEAKRLRNWQGENSTKPEWEMEGESGSI